VDRKTRLASLLNGASNSLRYNDHQIGQGPAFHRLACEHGLEGIVSKRGNGRYEPDRRTWLKVKCLNREEFVVVGWSDPEGSRHRIGALLLGYYTPQGRLYAGRARTGMPDAELERLWQRLQPLVVEKMPLAEPSPRGTRFGSPLVISRSIGCGPKWSSRSATSNGRLTVYSDTSSTWASAKTSWLRGAPRPTSYPRNLIPVGAGPNDPHRRHSVYGMRGTGPSRLAGVVRSIWIANVIG
jgi:hypothetical protein